VRHWELGNEPDSSATFTGGPAEYARWAALAAAGICAATPDAVIAVGGLAHRSDAFLAAALRDLRHPLIERVDIANVHLGGTLASVPAQLAAARAMYSRLGFTGPLWSPRRAIRRAPRVSEIPPSPAGRATRPAGQPAPITEHAAPERSVARSAHLAPSRSAARRTLPLAVFGSSAANSTIRGYL
jgi:hypothetical protein